MDPVLVVMVLSVGALAGVLAALLVDGRTLGRHLQTLSDENRRLQEKLQGTQGRLAAAQNKARHLHDDLDVTRRQIEALTAQNEEQAREMATAVARRDAAQEQVARVQATLDKLQEEHQTACRRLAVAAVELKHLQRDLAAAEAQQGELARLQRGKLELEQELKTAVSQIDDLQSRLAAAQHRLEHAGLKGKGQIEIINGIGPTYARRLYEAGVRDLAQLAQMEPARVAEIVKLKSWQRADPEAWIAEARDLASAFADGKEGLKSKE